MADTDALESLAELLPPERRERFFAIASKFRNMREDDDHLQMLEAVGFILLVMKEIPSEIATILDKAHRTIGEAESEKLRSEFVEVLTESLDTPSYKDLRDTVRSMAEHNEKFQRNSSTFLRHFSDAERTMSKRNRVLPNVANGLVAALATAAAVYFLLPLVQKPEPIRIPKDLQPFVALYREGKLSAFDVNLPEYDGEVRIISIGGDVITAFKDGSTGIVVVKPPDK